MMGKDDNRPVFETWFGLVLKDLRSRRTLPGTYAVILSIGTLIQTLTTTKMSMMTKTITSQVLHCRASEDAPDIGLALCMPNSQDSNSTKDEKPYSRQSLAESIEVTVEELDNQ